MKFAIVVAVTFACLCASAMPLGLRTAMWGDDIAVLNVLLYGEYTVDPDGSLLLNVSENIESDSNPKVTVKGLPAGLKYDAATMTISGRATKPGVYAVTVSATNATVKQPVTATFEIVVPKAVAGCVRHNQLRRRF